MKAECEHCKATYTVTEKFVGRSVTCKKCDQRFVVRVTHSGEAAAPTAPSPSPSSISVHCNACQKKFRAKPSLLGKKVKCPGCSQPLVVAAAEAQLETAAAAVKASGVQSKSMSRSPSARLLAVVLGCLLLGGLGVAYALGFFGSGDSSADPKKQQAGASSATDIEDEEAAGSNPEVAVGQESPAADGKKQPSTKPQKKPPMPMVDLAAREENGYQFKLTASIPERGDFVWQGTTIVSPKQPDEFLYTTGIAIPNQGVIVPLGAIKDCVGLTVMVDGKPYQATVKTRLKKLKIATLKIDRQEVFPRPVADLADRLGKRGHNIHMLWLNEGGEPAFMSNLSLEGGRDGIEYYLKTKGMPAECLGGVLIRDSGRIAGYVLTASKRLVTVAPWSRIASGWGKRKQGMFDYDSPVTSPAREQRVLDLAKYMVQVVVQKPKQPRRPSAPDKIYSLQTEVDCQTPLDETRLGEWNLPENFQNNSLRNIEMSYSPGKGLRVEAKKTMIRGKQVGEELFQLPFAIGAPCLKVFEYIADPSLDSWKQEKQMMFLTKDRFVVRPRSNWVLSNELHCIQSDEYRVITKSASTFKLERKTSLKPKKPRDYRGQFELAGKEEITVNSRTGWVSVRSFKGTFMFTTESGEQTVVPIRFTMTKLLPLELKKLKPYWR